jgi:hypothetical protein
MLDKRLTTRLAVGLQIGRTCDELNNVLTGIMLKAGLILRWNTKDLTANEIELLAIRARTVVQALRVVSDSLVQLEKLEATPQNKVVAAAKAADWCALRHLCRQLDTSQLDAEEVSK